MLQLIMQYIIKESPASPEHTVFGYIKKILQSPQEVLLIWASLHLPLLLIPIFHRQALNVLQLSNIKAEEFNNHGTIKTQGEKQLCSGPVTELQEVPDCKLLQQNLDKVPRADKPVKLFLLPSR